MTMPTQLDLDTLRLKSCVKAWGDCESGVYDPRCCRYPKECSPYGTMENVRVGWLTFDKLEGRIKPFPSNINEGVKMGEEENVYLSVSFNKLPAGDVEKIVARLLGFGITGMNIYIGDPIEEDED